MQDMKRSRTEIDSSPRSSVASSEDPDPDPDGKFLDIPEHVVSVIDMCRAAGMSVLTEFTTGYSPAVWKDALGIELRSLCSAPLQVTLETKVDVVYKNVRISTLPVDFVISEKGVPLMYLFLQRKATKLTQSDMNIMYNVQDQVTKQSGVRPWCMMLHFLPSALKTFVLFDGKIIDELEKDLVEDI